MKHPCGYLGRSRSQTRSEIKNFQLTSKDDITPTFISKLMDDIHISPPPNNTYRGISIRLVQNPDFENVKRPF